MVLNCIRPFVSSRFSTTLYTLKWCKIDIPELHKEPACKYTYSAACFCTYSNWTWAQLKHKIHLNNALMYHMESQAASNG